MKFLIVLTFAALCATVFASPAEQKEWAKFKSSHKKSFKSQNEESKRLTAFKKSIDQIKKHNELFKKGEVSFKMSANEFADVPHKEFVAVMNGFNSSIVSTKLLQPLPVKLRGAIPESKDWNAEGYVREIKNQGSCGSCWAFACASAIESYTHINDKNRAVTLSEQQLLDCSGPYCSCGGGHMTIAYDFVQQNGGIAYDYYYKYEGVQTQCVKNVDHIGARINGYAKVPTGDENALKKYVASGPVVVAIDANPASFQYYTSGVYYDPVCSSDRLTHAVVAVGYGTENGQDYWLVKNSWGTTWGDKGFVKMARNRDNHCGIATAAYVLV